MTRRTILLVAHRFPLPLVGGDHVKLYHVLRHLARAHDVTFVSADAEGCATPELIRELSSLGIDVHVTRFSQAWAWARTVRGLFSGVPLEMWYYNSGVVRKKVRDILARKKFDLAIAFFLRSSGYLPRDMSTRKILIAEDSRYLLESRASTRFAPTAEYLVRKLDAVRLRTYEPKAMKSFSHITFVTENDRRDVTDRDLSLTTLVLTNGVDLERFHFESDQHTRSGIIFSGRMDVYHNILIAERLATRIMPLVWRSLPDVRLTIAGSNPSSRVKKLASHRTYVTGYLSDVRQAIRRAAVFAHPQEIGAGIQNKLLETMALGTPAVTTSVGLSGINATNGVHALVRETDEEFAEAIVKLIGDESLRETLARNARTLIEEHYSWDDVLRALDRVVETP